MTEAIDRRLAAVFADAGCAGWLHARVIGGRDSAQYHWHADDYVVLASVYKLPLLIALCRLFDDGELSATDPVSVDPTNRAQGPSGLSVLHDPVTMSWRDLATLMMTVSDNAAADVILTRVGLARLGVVLAELGLHDTRIVSGMRELHQQLMTETGTTSVAEAFAMLSDPDLSATITAYDAASSSASTARECTRLLELVWLDRAASPTMCAFIRDTMHNQLFRQRIASGIPLARVAGKTGTLAAIRNEIAVVEFPGERPVAVAIFTKSARGDLSLPIVDAAVGLAARIVVTALRSPLDQPDSTPRRMR